MQIQSVLLSNTWPQRIPFGLAKRLSELLGSLKLQGGLTKDYIHTI